MAERLIGAVVGGLIYAAVMLAFAYFALPRAAHKEGEKR